MYFFQEASILFNDLVKNTIRSEKITTIIQAINDMHINHNLEVNIGQSKTVKKICNKN